MEIQRHLAGEPVLAAPPSARYRLRKFARKHRAALTTAAVITLLLVAGVAVSTWQAVRATRAEGRAVAERDEKEKARARTREALDEMSSHVIEDWLSRQPEDSPEQRDFLEKAAKFYAEFAAAPGHDESSLASIADAHLRLPMIFERLARYRDAVQSAGLAAKSFQALLDRDPKNSQARTGLIGALRYQVKGLASFGSPTEVDRIGLEAIRLAEELVAEAPNDASALDSLTAALMKGHDYKPAAGGALRLVADCRAEANQLAAAERDYSTAIEWISPLIGPREGATFWAREEFAAAHAGRARVRDRLGRYTEALADWDKALEYGPETERPSPYHLLAGKADTLVRAGQIADAETVLRKCLDLCQVKEPDLWTTSHVKSLLGGCLLGQKKYAEAEPLLLAGYEGMKKQEANIPQQGTPRLTGAVERLVQLYEATDKKDEAAKWRMELETAKVAAQPAAGP